MGTNPFSIGSTIGGAATIGPRTGAGSGGTGPTTSGGTRSRVEFDIDGWVDFSTDIVGPVKASWGIHGNTPKDRVADPGELSFEMDNTENNRGGVRGYYSPGGGAALAGFDIGLPVRLVLNHPLYGDKIKWQGTIDQVIPNPGVERPTVQVHCVDWMDEAARAKLKGLAVQTSVQSDALFATLVAAVDRQPPGGTISGTGSDVYPYALDNTQDETSRVLSELQKLVMSEYGIMFVSAGVAVFEGRKRRGGEGSIRFAMDEDEQILGMTVTHARDNVINRCQVSIHPRRRDAAATSVLFNLGSSIEIQRNTSVTINCPYRDPAQVAQRVGGVDMVAPVVTTDYKFNSAADGSGSDYSAQLTVTPTFGGNSADVTITNNGPNDGHVWFLQLRGRGLYDFEPVLADLNDADSLATYGENVYGYDMPYQSSPSNAVDLAQFIISLHKDATTRVETVTFMANWDDETVEQAFNAEISDRISVTSGSVGLVADPYFINGVTLELRPEGVVMVTWDLAPVNKAQFWVLDLPGRTELDETTVLGYGLFAVGWVLDSSTLNSNTFLN